MPVTYTAIESVYLSSNQATVTFSNIPNLYRDLLIKYSARSSASADFDTTYITFNGSSGGTQYGYTELQTNGSNVSSSRSTNLSAIQIAAPLAANATANLFGIGEIYIPNYLSSSVKVLKWHSSTERASLQSYVTATAGRWNNTSAITSITLDLASGNFVTNSNFHLYGIKNT